MNLSYVSYSQEECDPRIENIIPQDNYCIDQVFYDVGLWFKDGWSKVNPCKSDWAHVFNCKKSLVRIYNVTVEYKWWCNSDEKLIEMHILLFVYFLFLSFFPHVAQRTLFFYTNNPFLVQVLYPSGKVKQGAAFCILEEATAEKSDVRIIYSVFLGISDLFILISFIVYLTVPDQNKRGLNKNVREWEPTYIMWINPYTLTNTWVIHFLIT